MTPDYVVEIYKGKQQGRQAWRWRATDPGNHKIVAVGGEGYTNKGDCLATVSDLFAGQATVHLTHPNGQAVLREGQPDTPCSRCGHSATLHMTGEGCDACDCSRVCGWLAT